jgi:hypothetical protein
MQSGMNEQLNFKADLVLDNQAENNSLSNNAGNDLCDAENHDDSFYGEGGYRILNSHYANDTLYGEAGNDILQGGEEDDSFFCKKVKNTVFPPTIHVSEEYPNLINLPDGTIPGELFELATEYRQLAFLPELSKKQAERMGEILELAEEDELLNSLLIEADRSVFIKQDMLDEGKISYFRNQQAKLNECIEKDRNRIFLD